MQGHLVALEKGSTSVSSNEVNLTGSPCHKIGNGRRSSHNTFAVMDDEDTTEDLQWVNINCKESTFFVTSPVRQTVLCKRRRG